MKVLQINKMYTPDIGGVETVVKQYSEFLLKDNDVTVLCIKKSFSLKTSKEKIQGVEIIRCSSFGTFFSMPVSISFFYHFFLLKSRFDIIHIHEPFPLGSIASLLLTKKDKIFVTWHSDIIKQKSLKKIVEYFQNSLCKKARVIFTTSPNLLSFSNVISKYEDKVTILPLSINTNVNTKKLNASQYILCLGRLSYYKGISVLLEAYEMSKTDQKLLIVGDGDKNIVNAINLHIKKSKKEIIFINNFVSEEEKIDYIQNCSFFVFPSVLPSEAFGIIQLEVMLQYKPVINTNLPTGVPFVSLHMETGITVEPYDVEGLSNAITLLSSNIKLRDELGDNAFDRVIKCFSDGIVLRMLAEVYNKNIFSNKDIY